MAYVLTVTSCYGGGDGDGIAVDGGAGGRGGDANVDDRGGSSSHHRRGDNVPGDEESFRDFAMMLRAYVHASSHRNPSSGSVYDYEMHAFLHPRAAKCRSSKADGSLFEVRDGSEGRLPDEEYDGMIDRGLVLQNLGYKVSVRDPPSTRSSDMVGSEYLRDYLSENVGDEVPDLIRLYAYELEGYDAVALVDYDTLIVRPVDDVVDLIAKSNGSVGNGAEKRGGGEGGGGREGDNVENDAGGGGGDDDDGGIDAVFSWEHLPSLANPQVRTAVINLSFFLIRPSRSTLDELIRLYRTAPFSETRGFGTHGRGSFAGWMSTRGLLTYYYDEVANAAKVEMDRCSFGNTAEEYDADDYSVIYTAGGRVDCGAGAGVGGDGGGVADPSGQCGDCSRSKFEDVSVADLSYCGAPWECGGGDSGEGEEDDADNDNGGGGTSPASDTLLSSGLCRQYQRFWFGGRLQMEDVHPQLQVGEGKLCVDGRYMPMVLSKPFVEYKPSFV